MDRPVTPPPYPTAPPPDMPTTPPPDIVGREKANLQSGMQDILVKGGWSPEDAARQAELSSRKIPGSLESLVPAAVGMIPFPGGKLARPLYTLGANVLGAGAVGVGKDLANPTPAGPLAAGMQSAAGGVIPGAIAGILSGILGPSKATVGAQNAIKGIQAGETSPEVSGILSAKTPGRMLSRATVQEMQDAAGTKFQGVEDSLKTRLKNFMFTKEEPPPFPGMPPKQVPWGQFEDIRKQIKELREMADKQYTADSLNLQTKKMRLEASRLENEMIDQLRRRGKVQEAEDYAKAIHQYATDQGTIREVRAIQNAQKTAGGNNPKDRPDLGALDQVANPTGANRGAGFAEAGIGAILKHPWLFAKGLKQGMAGKSTFNPADTAPNPLISRGVPGLLGTGTAIGQDWMLGQPDTTP